jgi:hypothetical protein
VYKILSVLIVLAFVSYVTIAVYGYMKSRRGPPR